MATDHQYPSLNNNSDMPIKLAAIEAVQALPDIDEDFLFEAFDFLEKGKNAKMFIAMNANLRSRWLRRKLRPQPMVIFVTIIMYGNKRAFKVSMFTTIDELKAKLFGKEGYHPTTVCFIYAGKILEDGRKSLSAYNITKDCTIHCVVRICGC